MRYFNFWSNIRGIRDRAKGSVRVSSGAAIGRRGWMRRTRYVASKYVYANQKKRRISMKMFAIGLKFASKFEAFDKLFRIISWN